MRLETLVNSLTALREGLKNQADKRRFSEIWGAHVVPPITVQDVAVLVTHILEKLDAVDWEKTDQEDIDYLNAQAPDIDLCISNIVPHLFSQPQAIVSLMSFIFSLESIVAANIGFGELKGTLALPVTLHKQTRLAKERLEQASSALDDIDRKLEQIQNAYNAAENFPTTQKDLEDGLKELERTKKAALTNELAAQVSAEKARAKNEELDLLVEHAQSVLKNVKEAYRAATTQGLAQAFSERQKALSDSTRLWVGLLAASLVCAAGIGQLRFPAIMSALSANPQWGIVSLNIAISALSIAPAIWLAWMATKQIGQRFRLAEDYGYKAALAKAYEGYRNEAARLDPMFEAQLFATALGRLDELPLRLVEPDAPGSPLHELFKSTEFKDAVNLVPGLRERIVAVLKRTPVEQREANVTLPAVKPVVLEASKE